MSGVRGYQQYAVNEGATAGPEHLVVMAYDGMVRFLRDAEDAVQSTDHDRQNSSIQRVQNILSVLAASLDPSVDRGIARNLSALYDWYYLRLAEANIKGDLEILREVRAEIEGLRDAWQEAERRSRAERLALSPVELQEAA
ncbi:MAG: flagellar protein FliS [Armatimonadota bacterium]|nr:MAG: flagellar protein FliS [Armatimonadota bacterium]